MDDGCGLGTGAGGEGGEVMDPRYLAAIMALEACVAAMNAMTASAHEQAGDMTDADNARLWNAALKMGDLALAEYDGGKK